MLGSWEPEVGGGVPGSGGWFQGGVRGAAAGATHTTQARDAILLRLLGDLGCVSKGRMYGAGGQHECQGAECGRTLECVCVCVCVCAGGGGGGGGGGVDALMAEGGAQGPRSSLHHARRPPSRVEGLAHRSWAASMLAQCLRTQAPQAM